MLEQFCSIKDQQKLLDQSVEVYEEDCREFISIHFNWCLIPFLNSIQFECVLRIICIIIFF